MGADKPRPFTLCHIVGRPLPGGVSEYHGIMGAQGVGGSRRATLPSHP